MSKVLFVVQTCDRINTNKNKSKCPLMPICYIKNINETHECVKRKAHFRLGWIMLTGANTP